MFKYYICVLIFFLVIRSNIQLPESSVWLCFSAHPTQSLEKQNSNRTSQPQFCIFVISQSLCWKQYFWLYCIFPCLTLSYSQMCFFFYLNSVFVTGYLSILNDCTLTSLGGNSPSFPSAALVPINVFPPGISTISSAVRMKYILLFWQNVNTISACCENKSMNSYPPSPVNSQ